MHIINHNYEPVTRWGLWADRKLHWPDKSVSRRSGWLLDIYDDITMNTYDLETDKYCGELKDCESPLRLFERKEDAIRSVNIELFFFKTVKTEFKLKFGMKEGEEDVVLCEVVRGRWKSRCWAESEIYPRPLLVDPRKLKCT